MAAGDRRPMPRMVDRICANPACRKPFQARQADINRGWGKCCSRECTKAPTMPLKSQEEVESWMRTAHTGATWPQVMQYQRAEIDALRQLFPEGLRKLLEEVAQGFVKEHLWLEVCACCGADWGKAHKPDCVTYRAQLLIGREGDKLL